MATRDYYEVLGVDRNSEIGEIKKVYRNLAMKYHPDKNPGDKEAEERFKEVAEAYEVLKDPQKRARYDQFGHAGVSGAAGRGGFSGGGDFDLSDALRAFMRDFGGFGGAFDDFFGDSVRTQRRSSSMRGGDRSSQGAGNTEGNQRRYRKNHQVEADGYLSGLSGYGLQRW